MGKEASLCIIPVVPVLVVPVLVVLVLVVLAPVIVLAAPVPADSGIVPVIVRRLRRP